MYLEYIKAWNFGVHDYTEATFVDGFVVVRGGNAKGKSTLAVQAVMYSLFGTSTLDSPLDTVVTLGKNVNKLQTEAKYGPYIVKRSKASASVEGNGVQISGQAEVSNFFYDLFNLQKGTESNVLVSKQGKTAGVLDGKPSEVNTFIESLAGFDQIDNVIENVKDTYPSGQKDIFEERLNTLKSRLEILEAEEFDSIDGIEKDIETKDLSKVAAEAYINSLQEEIDKQSKELLETTKHNSSIELAQSKLDSKKSELESVINEYLDNQTKLDTIVVYNKEEIDKAKELIANLDEMNKAYTTYEWVQSLSWDGDVWDGDLESFQEELKSTADIVRQLTKKISDIESDIKVQKSKVITDKTCTQCGQDVEHLHKDLNEKIEVELERLSGELSSLTGELEENKDLLQALNSINNEHLRREKKVKLEYVTVERHVIPHNYVMDEPEKPDSKAVTKANNLLSEYKSSLDMKRSLENAVDRLETKREEISVELEDLEKSLESLGNVIDTKEISDNIAKIKNNKSEEDQKLKEIVRELSELNSRKVKLETDIDNNKKSIETVEADIKDVKAKLKTDNRNSKILKAVRDAKPKVLESVWNSILQSVSIVYSDITGNPTEVVKTTKGFLINGLPVARLSGSEKSVLGVALRATVRDIFAPSCGFILFDEPADNSDEDRSAALFAAIKLINGQKIVITHEEGTSLMADQIVEVG